MYYVSPSISVCVQYHIIIYILTVTVGILLYILIFQSCFYHGDMMEIAKKRREKR